MEVYRSDQSANMYSQANNNHEDILGKMYVANDAFLQNRNS